MMKKILVGFDGSPESRDAVQWAADEAVARGCPLEIVSCYRLPVASDVYGWTPTDTSVGLMDTVSQMVADECEAIHSTHPSLQATTRVCAGSAAHELVNDPAELIVLGASSHRGTAAFWLGSTPRVVVRRAGCPVVVVRGDARPDGLRRVVVGVDDSEHAMVALRWAAAEADLHDVTLLVVHAWEYPYQNPDGSPSQARDLTRVDAARILNHAVEQGRDMCGGDVTGELIEGSPGSAILDFVGDGDLLVLGSRGRGAWRTGLFGSTVNRVLDEAAVPVAVVRRDEDRRA